MNPTKSSPSIEVIDLTRKFGNFTAVDHISFQVARGEIFGFLGANGAGKTTAIRMMSGLLTPTSGKAMVAGFDVGTQAEKVKAHIGYMSQKFSLYPDLTVYQNFRFYAGVYGLSMTEIKQKAGEMLRVLDLESVRNSPVGDLPLGWKQKLAFAVASAHNPEIIFLDEPTSGVDPVARRQFWDLIYRAAHEGTTILITTHYMEEAEYCDRISIMVDGRISALGRPDELKSRFNVDDIDRLFIRLAKKDAGDQSLDTSKNPSRAL